VSAQHVIRFVPSLSASTLAPWEEGEAAPLPECATAYQVDVAPFFTFARERYLVKLRKEAGGPKPWTSDVILQEYRFCNVFREDDTVTKVVKKYIRDGYRNAPHLVYLVALARFLNRSETIKFICREGGPNVLDPDGAASLETLLRRFLKERGPPLTGAAYMIKTPTGLDKIGGIMKLLEPLRRDCTTVQKIMASRRTLRDAHEMLMCYPFFGPFMSYEIVTDLRHTPVLFDATDKMTWCNLGPGAMRGYSRLLTGSPLKAKKHQQSSMIELCRELLNLSRTQLWQRDWPEWEMREVEHLLCEFDKYERARLGEGTPKQRYPGKA
jgi:hypothetical protein